MLKRVLCLLLASLLLFSLFACKKPTQESVPPNEEQTPKSDTHTPAELDTTDYVALTKQQFSDLVEAPATDFEYETVDNTVTLLSYLGNDAHVKIPDTIGGIPVTGIKEGLFQNTSTVTILSIPASVTDFEKGALSGCKNLYALRTPFPSGQGNQFFGYLFGADTYQRNNLPDLRNLDFLELVGELPVIPDYAFYDCNDLVSVLLPESTTAIGKLSFSLCESLKYINLEKIETVADFAFLNSAALQILLFSNNLKSVGLGAFEGCNRLQELTLPFVGQSKIENAYLAYIFGATSPSFSKTFYPQDLTTVKLLPGIESLHDYALLDCYRLKNISLPEGLLSIGVRAFSGCSALQSITLPESLSEVRENAFFSCSSLTSVSFGSGITSLGINTFYGCSSLTGVTLPKALTSLPNSCFADCKSLQTVDLCNITSVGAMAFRNCSALQHVTANGSVTFAAGNDSAKQLLKSPN